MSGVIGDVELGLRARTLLGKRHTIAAVGAVTPSGSRVAAWGAELIADYEIGSISKGITGLLYSAAIARGEINLGTTLDECLPLEGSEVGKISLASLSIHRSGLRTLPSSESVMRWAIAVSRHGTNPYSGTLDDLLSRAADEQPRLPKPRYSNFGYQLLGHAVAARAGTTFRELVGERIARPLDLTGLHVPHTEADLAQFALTGHRRSGKVTPPWLGEALGPAGGARATVGDMSKLTEALLAGTAPGMSALDPVADFGRGARIGAAWITISNKQREITWHNGGTGGFRTWMGLDRKAGTGLVVLSAFSRSVDAAGFRLLSQVTEESGGTGTRQTVGA